MYSLPALRNRLPTKSFAIQKQPDIGYLFKTLLQARICAVSLKTALGFVALLG
jgi:hypothetical protein